MPSHSTELLSPLRYASLPDLMLGLAGLAKSLGIPVHEIPRLQLVLEELFSNSINHGFGGESDAEIGIGLRAGDGVITLIYRDQAAAFDLSERSVSNPADDQVGGLGINLILGIASAVRYQRRDNSNLLEIDF